MNNIVYTRATTIQDLEQILDLQKRNIATLISNEEKQNEGFVTVKHSFETLKAMNDACPHIIATHQEKVIGYALCMLHTFRNDVPELKPMFQYIDNIITARGLNQLRYLVMGQICIDKAYRKQGIFKKLYHFFKEVLSPDFNAVITEVNSKNRRSAEAHKAVGFELLDTHTEAGACWELIIWKWT